MQARLPILSVSILESILILFWIILLIIAQFSATFWSRTVHSSSENSISKHQCKVFSIAQWLRTRISVFEKLYDNLIISMMFLEKVRCFFSIFPVISAPKPMKMAKTDFRRLRTLSAKPLTSVTLVIKYRFSQVSVPFLVTILSNIPKCGKLLLIVAQFSATFRSRTVHSSSENSTSKHQCKVFSIAQWLRTLSAKRLTSVTLVIK